MPRGIYKRKSKTKNLPAIAGEFPLDAIPERPIQAVKAQRPSLEGPLVGLAHRLMDQQDRLMTMVETLQATNQKKRGAYKAKKKAKT